MFTLAQETLRLAPRGLKRRARLDRNGRDETRYLRPLEEIDRARHHAGGGIAGEYFNDWGQSVEPLFEEYAYYCRPGRARCARAGTDTP